MIWVSDCMGGPRSGQHNSQINVKHLGWVMLVTLSMPGGMMDGGKALLFEKSLKLITMFISQVCPPALIFCTLNIGLSLLTIFLVHRILGGLL